MRGEVAAAEGAHPDVGRPGRAAQHGGESRGRTPSAAYVACTKADEKRFGVQYSYIWNCETEEQGLQAGL